MATLPQSATAATNVAPTAALVVIGNEVLSGKVADSNSPFVARQLTQVGVDLRRIITLPDDTDLIAATVRDLSHAFDWVFTSGGIGPTHDDMTVAAVAQAFAVPLVLHPRLEADARAYYGERLKPAHLQMAQVPEGTELLDLTDLGFPLMKMRNVFILPGVPQFFEAKFMALKNTLGGVPISLHQLFLHAEEGQIAEALQTVEARFAGVQIGSYPSYFNSDYRVKITVECRDPANVSAAVEALRPLLLAAGAQILREEGAASQ